MADAVVAALARSQTEPEAIAATARAEAERLFATDVVVAKLSQSLERLGAGV